MKEVLFIKTRQIQKLYLSRITKSSFPDLITRISLSICVRFLFSQPITKWCKVLQKSNPYMLWPKTKITLVHHILYRSYCVFTLRVLWPMSFLIFIIDKVKNFATNNLPQVGVLVMYWDLCIERRDYRYNTSPIKYWYKGSTVGWY